MNKSMNLQVTRNVDILMFEANHSMHILEVDKSTKGPVK